MLALDSSKIRNEVPLLMTNQDLQELFKKLEVFSRLYRGDPHSGAFRTLHEAAQKGSLAEVKQYVEAGWPPSANIRFYDPVNAAAAMQKSDVVAYLLSQGAVPDRLGLYRLREHATERDFELLLNAANIDQSERETILSQSTADSYDTKERQQMLKQANEEFGREKNRQEVLAQELIADISSGKFDLLFKSNIHNCVALILEALNARLPLVAVSIAKRIDDFNAISTEKLNELLQMASQFGLDYLVARLLKLEAALDLDSSLCAAANHGQLEVVELLLRQGALPLGELNVLSYPMGLHGYKIKQKLRKLIQEKVESGVRRAEKFPLGNSV